MKNAQCTNCNQYKVVTYKSTLRATSVATLVFAIMSLFLIPLGIGIILVPAFALISIGSFLVSFTSKGAQCRNCKAVYQ